MSIRANAMKRLAIVASFSTPHLSWRGAFAASGCANTLWRPLGSPQATTKIHVQADLLSVVNFGGFSWDSSYKFPA